MVTKWQIFKISPQNGDKQHDNNLHTRGVCDNFAKLEQNVNKTGTKREQNMNEQYVNKT